MEHLHQSFTIKYEYNVFFTSGLFAIENPLLNDFLSASRSASIKKILYVVDEGVVNATPDLIHQIKAYFGEYDTVQLIQDVLIVPGGEVVKNDPKYFEQVLQAVNTYGIDRHSYIAAIGGGAVLDMAGYAATVSHRGVKHI